MPKKKAGKKKGKGKGGAKGDAEGKAAAEEDHKPFEAPSSTERELALRSELSELNLELGTLQKQVEELRVENEWLAEEADRTKTESQDYQTYVSRKAQKRQSLVVSLSDRNRAELGRIQREKEELLRDFEEKSAGLSATLMARECELARVRRDLTTLEPFMSLRRDQEAEISRLERVLEEEQFSHEDRVRALKTRFLREKRLLEGSAESRIRAMAETATKEASQCLRDHSAVVRSENHRLRAELRQLIEVSNELQTTRCRMETQYQTLLRGRGSGMPTLARTLQ